MIEAARAGLVANANFLTKLGNVGGVAKVYFEEADQTVSIPFVILSQIDSESNDTKNSVSHFDQSRVQVFYYSQSFQDSGAIAGATVLANLGRAALDHVTVTFNSKANFFRFESRKTFSDEIENKKVVVVEDIYEVYNTN